MVNIFDRKHNFIKINKKSFEISKNSTFNKNYSLIWKKATKEG